MPADPGLRSSLARRQRRDLRGGLGQPVRRRERDARIGRARLDQLGWNRAAAQQHATQPVELRTGFEQTPEHRPDERSDRRPLGADQGGERSGVEPLDQHAGPVDDASHQDRQASDVVQREAAEPEVARVDADPHT